ncbi:hypothetical protein QUF56_11300 [Ureibacillus composti]|nr:hypothetical protein [Ureibacillus composti]
MCIIKSSEELMSFVKKMDRDNSVLQFSIPGKGKYTLVLQEMDDQSIASDIIANPQLEQMIKESQIDYKKGEGMTTSELLKSISVEDFK